MAAVGLIAQNVEFVAAGLGKVDQSVSRRVHVVVALLCFHEENIDVLIPVRSRLDLEVCGGGGGGFGGAGGEGQGQGEKQRGEKASFHKKNSFLRRAISDKPIIAEGFIRCQL